jgi:amino acid adenylation domain-containing protein/non-ribosomal peptide synthase protein (TIGR01720 family)
MSLAFDSSWEQINWLLLGHELHLCDEEQRRDAEALVAFVRDRRIDTIDLSPSMLQQMVECGLLDGGHVPPLILVGGEAVPAALWQRLRVAPGVTAFNYYGPTEYSIDSLGADLLEAESPIIGRPIANSRISILDEALRPVPIGRAGELYIAGPGLALGYLGKPDLTAARFVADPFEPGARVYRTGDLVRWRADGQVEFLGRTDHQVKIRGFRVELPEVEHAIAAMPGVTSALVLAIPSGVTHRLIAYCTGTGDSEAWLGALAQTLPDYMLPSSLTRLDAWPLTVNGKIDRAALPAPMGTVPPAGPIVYASDAERMVCEAVAEIIGLSAVRPDADFFSLGGDSIGAMALGTAMRRQGQILRPRDVFAYRRADRMATILSPLKRQHFSEAEELTGDLPPLPMTLWFALHHGLTTRFTHGALMRVPTGLETTHLEQALAALLRAHPILRARVEAGGLTIAAEEISGDVLITEVSSPEEGTFDATFATASARLDPAAGRIMQAIHWPGHSGEGWLMIVLHHLVTDGISWRVILPELEAACESAMSGATPFIPREECTARQWATLLGNQRDTRRAELPLWREILEAPVSTLAARAIDPKRDTLGTAQQRRLLLDVATTQALLDRLPRACRATVEELLLAALLQGTGELFGAKRLRVTMESHGREMLDEETDPSRTVGWLTTEYPVLLESGRDPIDAVRSAKQALRRIADHGIGYSILRYLDAEGEAALGPLEARAQTDILFNYLGRFATGPGFWTPVAIGGRFADAFAVDTDPAMAMLHPLEINAFIEENADAPRLAINWTWADGLFEEQQVELLHASIGAALDKLDRLAQAQPLDAADTLVPADCPGLSQIDFALLRERHGAADAILPLLPLQEGLLFHAQLGEAASKYNSVTRIDLNGPLNRTRLLDALNGLLKQHVQLGARFDMQCVSGPWQIVPLMPACWPITEHDLSDYSPINHEAHLATLEQVELTRDFAVEGDLLVHATLARLGTGRHCLLLNAHHLVVDGWSTPIIVRDFLQAYREGADSLSTPIVPYAEVVSRLAARDTAPARAAWAEALDGAHPTLLFGEAAAAPDVRETELILSPELERALRECCRDHGLTLNTVMQGMWGALLSLMTGRSDVLFGAPVSGRTSPVEGVDAHIGLFSNTVPVRVTLAPGRPLLDQLTDLQARQGGLIEHDGLSLAEIQRLAGGDTLFDTLLVSENYPADDALLARDHGGVRVTGLNNRGYTHYPLTIMVLPGERLRLLIEHRDLLREPQALVARMRLILEHIAFAGDVPWSSFDPRLPEEVALIDDVNATGAAVPEVTLRDLLAERMPDALALVDGEYRLGFAEMVAQVAYLGERLRAVGVGPGDIVAVALPRSVRLTIAIHAVIEAGAAYLPLDTGYPTDRIVMMLEDARPRLIITEAALTERLPAAEHLLFETLATVEETARPRTPPTPLSPTDPAYLIYTSGSTGRPKGALLSHRAIVNRLLWMQHAYRITGSDRVLQKTPCSFDVSVWEFFWPLIEGATLVMAPPEAHRDPEALARIIAEEQITTLHFVPSMLAAFLGWIEEDTPARAPLMASLRQVFASGEALSSTLAERHHRLLPHAPLHNLYGPTEAAVDVTYRPATAGTEGASIPIGRPVWNTELRILDNALRPVPVGVPGELYLCGVQLADYYLDRPGLTASRFVADPLGEGTRMYRTGDIACWRADGEVEYLGRSDDQLKIRGQRIELGEIEAALLAQPGVMAAAANACLLGAAGTDGADTRQIVGYVVPTEGMEPDSELLRDALSRLLPAHMVPVAILPLAALPLSLNGKLDRKALPLPSMSETEGRAPRPGMESRIASAFAHMLDLPSVQAEDDFFALGGHSLLAMRLAAELRTALERPVSVGQIMGAPSVARLAALLSDEEAARDPANAGFGPLLHLRGGRGKPLFCFHPASGFAWQYSGLSRYLPRHLPLVGLQSPRDGGVIAASLDLDAACETHLATLRSVQPKGPYHLIGYSLGGTLAQGVAARLQALGEEVAFLGLFDTYPPEGQDWSGSTNDEAQQEADREREQFLAATEEEIDAEDATEKDMMFEGIVANYADAVKLLAAGHTPRFDGRATLFVATRTLPEGWDIEGCWAPFLSGLDIVCVDSAHEDILAPATLETVGPMLAALLEGLPSLG